MDYTSLISPVNKKNNSNDYTNRIYKRKTKKSLPKHKGDFKNYPVTNRMFNLGLTPAKIIDKDSDRYVSWEDCNDNDPNKYGLWSSAKKAVSRVVSKVKSTASKIGPAIQGNNYGTGTSVGGTTVTSTGPTVTTTGTSTPSRGSTSVVSAPTRGGGSSGGGSYNPSTQTYTSPTGQKQSMSQAYATQLSAQQRAVQTQQAKQAQILRDIQSRRYIKPEFSKIVKPSDTPKSKTQSNFFTDIYRKTFFTDKTGAKVIINEAGEKVLVPTDVSRIESVRGSRGYQSFQEKKEPVVELVTGLTAIPRMTAPVFNTIFDVGRREEDTSLVTGKVYRGGLAFGKFGALMSNPITGIPTGIYYGSELGTSFVKDPLGTVSGVTSYIKEEPFEFAGALAGAKKGQQFYKDPLKKVEVKKLETELANLGKKDFTDTMRVKIGEGSKINSDLVEIMGSSKTSDFAMDYIVKGELIANKKGFIFFPEGQGTAIVRGKFKTPKTKERLFFNVQTFEVGAKGEGIPLKNVGKVEIGTAVGSSTFIPTKSVTQIIKNPRNLYENIKESVRLKVKKPIEETGGTIFKQIETDLTSRMASVKLEGESPIKRYGISTSRGRRGSFFEIEEPAPEVVKIRTQSPTFQKTPLSKTFGVTEPVKSQVDLVAPRMKTQSLKITTLGSVSKNVQRGISQTAVRNIPRMTGGLGLKQIPFSGTGLYERSEGKVRAKTGLFERTDSKTLQDIDQIEEQKTDFKLLTGQIITPTTSTKERTIPDVAITTEQIIIPKQTPKAVSTFFYGEAPIPKPPLIINPIIIGFPKPRKKPKYVKGVPHAGFIKVDATKKNKARWQQVTEPTTKESSTNEMAEFLDKSISAVGKIQAVGQKIAKGKDKGKYKKVQVKDSGNRYLEQNNNYNKFRNFKIRKGQPVLVGKQLVEKRKYRLDTPGEKRAVQKGRRRFRI